MNKNVKKFSSILRYIKVSVKLCKKFEFRSYIHRSLPLTICLGRLRCGNVFFKIH